MLKTALRHSAYAALLLSASFAMADETAQGHSPLTEIPLEQLLSLEVITASKIARQVSDAPSAVSIVTAQDIHDYGYRTLADILNSMRGLYITSDRTYDYLGGRGYGRPGDFTGRIMLLIDGVQANENFFNQSFIGFDGVLDTALIERVEYISGPGSVSYGNNAFFGVINIVTKKGLDFDGAQASMALGSYESRQARLSYGKRLENGVDVLVSGSGFNTPGQTLYFPEFDSPATNHGIARHLDDQRNRRLFGKLQGDNWSVEAGYSHRLKDFPTAPYGADFNTAPSFYEDDNKFISAKHHSDLSDHLKMSLQTNYGDYIFHGAYIYSGNIWKESSVGRWWDAEAKFVGTWFAGHTLVFGTEYRADYQRKNNNPASRIDEGMQTVSLFAQDEISLRPDWQLNLGARYDYNTEESGHFSPRLALIYQLRPETTLRLSHSQAFRLPNAYEKYYDDGGTTIPNSRLKRESVRTTELVAEQHLGNQQRMLAAIYHQRTDDFISFEPYAPMPGASQAVNTKGGRAIGVELEYERHWEKGLRLRASYTFQHSEDSNGNWAVNSPRQLGKLNLSTPILTQAWRAGLEVQTLSRRKTEAGSETGGYALANLTLTTDRLLPHLDVALTVRNLFDRDYAHVAPASNAPIDTLQQDGRSYWLQFTYDFK